MTTGSCTSQAFSGKMRGHRNPPLLYSGRSTLPCIGLYQDLTLVLHDDDRPIHLFEDILFLGKKKSSCCILVWNLFIIRCPSHSACGKRDINPCIAISDRRTQVKGARTGLSCAKGIPVETCKGFGRGDQERCLRSSFGMDATYIPCGN
jgi:hypothetical protein